MRWSCTGCELKTEDLDQEEYHDQDAAEQAIPEKLLTLYQSWISGKSLLPGDLFK